MYKFLLCTRYATTRWIGLVSVVSVMLGVATMIIVNSIMGGFQSKMKDRLHGVLSDVMVGVPDINGFPECDRVMAMIREKCGDRIEAMTPVMEVYGLVGFDTPAGRWLRPVTIVGVLPEGRALVGDFSKHLVNPENQAKPSFARRADALKWRAENPDKIQKDGDDWPGAIVGFQIANQRFRNDAGEEGEFALLPPGSEFVLSTIAAGKKPEPVHLRHVVVDWFKCDMTEYDASLVFVPLESLQDYRLAEGRVTSIQIKLKDYYADAPGVVSTLQETFSPYFFDVQTWEHKQGNLLRAVKVEGWLLNFLLFFIIAVAGFGILAVFFMIVVEKTRDIGILKALGASDGGVMGIFVAYGLVLGLVGCALGAALGVSFTLNINPIESWLSSTLGIKIFPRDIYYFKDIPAILDPVVVVLVNVGALAIAVAASVLPALRAARLRPVEALRYE